MKESSENLIEIAKKSLKFIMEGNLTQTFRECDPVSKSSIISSLVSGFKITKDHLYLDIAENLIEDHFMLLREQNSHDEENKQNRLLNFDPTQVKSAFFGNSLIYLYENTRNRKYLDFLKPELDYLVSEERLRMKKHGHLVYSPKEKEISGQNALFVFPFWIKLACIIDDRMLISKGINEYLGLIHELYDDATGLYFSKFRKSFFGYKKSAKHGYLSINIASILFSLEQVLSTLRNLIGIRDFKGNESAIAAIAQELIDKIIKSNINNGSLTNYVIFRKFYDNSDMGILSSTNKKNPFDFSSTFMIMTAILRFCRNKSVEIEVAMIIKQSFMKLWDKYFSLDDFGESKKNGKLINNVDLSQNTYFMLSNLLYLIFELQNLSNI